MNCEHCGAKIDLGAHTCPYCKVTTAAGAAAQQRLEHEGRARAEWAAAAEHHQAVAAHARMTSTASHALGWSIGGLLLCCLPLGVVGAVQGFRARSMAATLRAPVPAKATIGLVLGILSSLTSIGGFTTAIIQSNHDQERTDARIAVLDKQTAQAVSAPVVDNSTACALGEAYALRNGFDDHRGYTLGGFDCVGKLTTRGDAAELQDLRFKWSTSTKYEVNVCLKRGAKWYVSEMRKDRCPAASE
jgi:hypothetical protein